VRIVSCNPAELKDQAVPPVFSGYGEGDRAAWPAFREAYRRTHADLWAGFAEFVRASGGGTLADGPLGPDFITESPWLDLYVYPAELDYARAVSLSPTWHRLESCVRASGPAFELPAVLAGRDEPLVYLSLGSLGSADVALMQRLIDLLAEAPLRVIVSLGPQHDQLRLPASMWGAEFVPQPAILPLVDVVITHGGNNTVTESLHHGKPMVVLPLFWDQYDNAQRLHDSGFGVRLPTYTFPDEALVAAVLRLHGDVPLRARLATIAGRLQASPGTVRAADLIERLAIEQRPVERG
jgi:UDP:flavonoid glycosyltransferase YjiC (YdhE family)